MEEKILNVLISMQSDICDMKSEISGIKSEISDMKNDICNIKTEIKEMKEDIKQLNQRMDRLEIANEKHEKNYVELKNQRQIDSNNIAKILSIQTQMLKNQDKMYA